MKIIPIVAKPSQTLSVVIGNQPCKLNIYQKSTGLFIDVLVNDALIIAGVIALNANKIVRSAYLGFVGDLTFLDTQGASDPDYTGLGDRFILAYIEASEL